MQVAVGITYVLWRLQRRAGGGPSGPREVPARGRPARGRGWPGTMPDRAQLPPRARPPWVGFLSHPPPENPGSSGGWRPRGSLRARVLRDTGRNECPCASCTRRRARATRFQPGSRPKPPPGRFPRLRHQAAGLGGSAKAQWACPQATTLPWPALRLASPRPGSPPLEPRARGPACALCLPASLRPFPPSLGPQGWPYAHAMVTFLNLRADKLSHNLNF